MARYHPDHVPISGNHKIDILSGPAPHLKPSLVPTDPLPTLTESQTQQLEQQFKLCKNPDPAELSILAVEMGLQDKDIMVSTQREIWETCYIFLRWFFP